MIRSRSLILTLFLFFSVVHVILPDHYGRNMGKRFDADFFVNDALKSGTHACDYLLACTMNMDPIPGFKFANWENGYGVRSLVAFVPCAHVSTNFPFQDVHLVPDMSSMRLAAWQPKTAMVCAALSFSLSLSLSLSLRRFL